MSKLHQAPFTVTAEGTVTTPEEIEAILEAAALRDDLPPDFHRLPVPERQRILGLTGPPTNKEQ